MDHTGALRNLPPLELVVKAEERIRVEYSEEASRWITAWELSHSPLDTDWVKRTVQVSQAHHDKLNGLLRSASLC